MLIQQLALDSHHFQNLQKVWDGYEKVISLYCLENLIFPW